MKCAAILPFLAIAVARNLISFDGLSGSKTRCTLRSMETAIKKRDLDVFSIARESILNACIYLENQWNQESDSKKVSCYNMMTDFSLWISKKITNADPACPYSISDTIKSANNYLSPDAMWEFLGAENGVSVWKLNPSSISLKKEDRQWPCVKSSTVIKIDSKTLVEYLMDSAKVPEYNKYCAGRADIEKISKRSKIVWNRTCIPLAIKSYDFCTLMHYYVKPPRNEIVLVSKGVQHPSVPINRDYFRSESIMGLNILQSIPANKKRGLGSFTEITCISHVKYGGTLPYVIHKSLFRGAIKYLHNLKEKIHRNP